MLTIIWVAFDFCYPWIKANVPRTFVKWIMVVLAFVSVLPLVIFEVIFPHAIDITVDSDHVEYEFRDRVLAYEFAGLNEDAGSVEIS